MSVFYLPLAVLVTLILWSLVFGVIILGTRWLAEQRHRQDRETRRRHRRSRDRLPPNWHERD